MIIYLPPSYDIPVRYIKYRKEKTRLEKELKIAVKAGNLEKAQIILQELEQLKFHIVDPMWWVIR